MSYRATIEQSVLGPDELQSHYRAVSVGARWATEPLSPSYWFQLLGCSCRKVCCIMADWTMASFQTTFTVKYTLVEFACLFSVHQWHKLLMNRWRHSGWKTRSWRGQAHLGSYIGMIRTNQHRALGSYTGMTRSCQHKTPWILYWHDKN